MPHTLAVQREKIARLLSEQTNELALAAATHHIQNDGAADTAEGLTEQILTHLHPLANAVLMNSPALFDAHLHQIRSLASAATPDFEISQQLAALRQVLLLRLPIGEYVLVSSVLSSAIQSLAGPPPPALPEAGALASAAGAHSAMADRYLELLMAADRSGACQLLLDAARQGTDVREIYMHVLQPVQQEVGARWHSGEINVAVEHFCTATTALVMAQLHSYFSRTPRNGRRLLATTVAGDLHIVGLQMVVDFLEYDGWDVYFLGASTPTESILRTAADLKVDLVVTAASMPHHVPLMRELISALRHNSATDKVRIVVGGRPFNHDNTLWQQIGADAWAPSANGAAEAVRQLFA